MKKIYCDPAQTLGCAGCGKCCGSWGVPVTGEEFRRICALPLTGLPVPVERCFKRTKEGFWLAKRDGRCIFLDAEKKCRIHAQFGFEAKPLTCRLYPLDVRTWSDGSVSASLRCDCPAAACGQGTPLGQCGKQISAFAGELEGRRKTATADYSDVLAPEVVRLHEIADAYERILMERSVPLNVRFYAAACLVHFHSKPGNSDDILEAEEFGEDAFSFFRRSVDHLSACLADPPKLRRDALVAFRFLFWNFLRADESASFLLRLRGTFDSLRFILGGGTLKRTSAGYDVNAKGVFAAMRRCTPEPGAFEPYLRFLRGRLASLHFCGTPSHGLTFEEGMLYLLASYPVIRALASLSALSHGRLQFSADDMMRAVMRLDHGFLRTGLYSLKSMRSSLRKLVSEENFAALLACCPEKAE